MNTTDQNIFNSRVQPATPFMQADRADVRVAVLCSGRKIFWSEHLANFGLAFPAGPVLPVKIHEMLG